ncbi:transposase [Nocardia sp. NPDC050793]|uniref:transposase n=1 Tax=Nocardia sp. NPDC050793 TaxID=3155159 RepID=UPI00340CB824
MCHSPLNPDAVVGVDLGIKHLAVLSEAVPGVTDVEGMVANPKHLDRARGGWRWLQRRAARRRRPKGVEPSQRWLRTNRSIARAHTRITNARSNGLHRLTAALTGRFGTIVIEDLNVAGLLRNRRLARAIADTLVSLLRPRLLAIEDESTICGPKRG